MRKLGFSTLAIVAVGIFLLSQYAASAAGLSWVGVGIYTTKNGEDLYQQYFRTEAECWSSPLLMVDRADRICIPVPELPQEMFENQVSRCIENGNRFYFMDRKIQAHTQLCVTK